jgi:hypothetical protein
MNFDHWRDRYCWIIGAMIIMTAIAIIIVQFRSTRPTRSFTLVALATGFGIGGLLFVPSVPRILTALRHFVIAKAPTATSGPFQVTAVNAALLASAANDPTIVVQIWYPAAANLPATDLLSESATPVACSKVMDDRRLSNMTILIDDDVFPRPISSSLTTLTSDMRRGSRIVICVMKCG